MNKIVAVKTGKSAALRIEIPKLVMSEDFMRTSESDIVECFEAISALDELARFCELVRSVQQ